MKWWVGLDCDEIPNPRAAQHEEKVDDDMICLVTESSAGWKIGGWHRCRTCTVTDSRCGWNMRRVGRGQCYLFCDSYNPGAAEDWEVGMGVVPAL